MIAVFLLLDRKHGSFHLRSKDRAWEGRVDMKIVKDRNNHWAFASYTSFPNVLCCLMVKERTRIETAYVQRRQIELPEILQGCQQYTLEKRQSFQRMMLRNLDLNMQKYRILIDHLANGLENSTYKVCYFETDRGKSRYASTYGCINRCSG